VDRLVADPESLAIDAVVEFGKRISSHLNRDAIEHINDALNRAPGSKMTRS